MILQILARCGAFFIGFVVKGQMNHDFAFRIEVNPCVIEITIGNANALCAFETVDCLRNDAHLRRIAKDVYAKESFSYFAYVYMENR